MARRRRNSTTGTLDLSSGFHHKKHPEYQGVTQIPDLETVHFPATSLSFFRSFFHWAMNMYSSEKESRNAKIVLVSVLLLWGLAFLVAHGMVVFAYVALHGMTTGVFCYAIYRVDKKASQSRAQDIKVPVGE